MSEANTPVTEGTTSTTATETTAAPTTIVEAKPTLLDSTTETKVEGETSTETKEPVVEGAPEKYEFVAPEGVTFDSELLGEFEGVARELNLSQEKASKLSDIGAKVVQRFEAKQAEAIETASTEWSKQTATDKEFGGDQATLDANLAVAKSALDTFGTPELRTLLRDSRLGNHPEVVRFMFRAGKALAQDKHVPGSMATGDKQSAAQRMYPNMNP